MCQLLSSFLTGQKRKRCGDCEGCKRDDCGSCKFCKDKPRFGGPNKKKQCCIMRRCHLATTEKVRTTLFVRTHWVNLLFFFNIRLFHPTSYPQLPLTQTMSSLYKEGNATPSLVMETAFLGPWPTSCMVQKIFMQR